ncbi:GatB/YqeY domain-containing protein [Adlercreutzia mucosicola]|uniref:GatB/YqeY domain-containing protein n=1 Tax=Adlercreutzia mucosicola TaxID=580026 RepID=UPI00040E34C6|nr:GatB/YqeY domain-containing protein [Adlercreutzia mucosicola]MCR2033891.1 GatB/YqeY domain-containing protein [Adlercreutzia mucosicola]
MEYQVLQDEIKAAMKARDNHRRDILRQVHTECKAIEVNERRDVTEADVDAMLKRVIKQTKETLDGSIKAGNNQERTDALTAQVAILEGYLPKQVEGEELVTLIDAVLADAGAATKKDMGRVMGELTKRTGGNFDKAAAAKELGSKLS